MGLLMLIVLISLLSLAKWQNYEIRESQNSEIRECLWVEEAIRAQEHGQQAMRERAMREHGLLQQEIWERKEAQRCYIAAIDRLMATMNSHHEQILERLDKLERNSRGD